MLLAIGLNKIVLIPDSIANFFHCSSGFPIIWGVSSFHISFTRVFLPLVSLSHRKRFNSTITSSQNQMPRSVATNCCLCKLMSCCLVPFDSGDSHIDIYLIILTFWGLHPGVLRYFDFRSLIFTQSFKTDFVGTLGNLYFTNASALTAKYGTCRATPAGRSAYIVRSLCHVVPITSINLSFLRYFVQFLKKKYRLSLSANSSVVLFVRSHIDCYF